MKSFKFLIATLLLGAAFVGCAQTGTSVTPSENETVSSSQVVEESSSVVEESSSIVEESSSVVEESSSQAPVEVTYEATASLNLDLSAYDPANQGDITLDSTDPIAMGDFTALIKAGKQIIVNKENKDVEVNGETVTYSKRLNNKSGDNKFEFEATKGGKLVVVCRSSGKKDTDTRILHLFDEDGAELSTADIIGGTGVDGAEGKNAAYLPYEVTFAEAGFYTFQIKGGASHILDMRVYYQA